MPVQESAARMPGWTLLRNPDTKSVRYRAPDGTEVGAWAYNTAYKVYQKSGIAPQSPIGTRWQRFQNSDSSSSHNSPDNDGLVAEINLPDSDSVISLELPDPRPTPASRSRSGLFTARELSDGTQAILVILTSILAVATGVPEAQMTDTEVKAISIPLANIVERSRYNKTIGSVIVGKSDYLTLGYAMYIYVNRVATATRERKNAQSSRGPQPTSQPGTNGSYNGGYTGVPLRPASSGLRGFTPLN